VKKERYESSGFENSASIDWMNVGDRLLIILSPMPVSRDQTHAILIQIITLNFSIPHSFQWSTRGPKMFHQE
jgi:hypothetical protein